MPELSTTAEERLERVRATLAGTARADSRAARRLRLGPAGNLLTAALLRAAERLDAGEELTGLEERLVGVLRIVVPDEEITAFGRVYREAVAQGAVGCLPKAVTSRSAVSGYAMADLIADLGEAAPQILAQPNVNIVNVADLVEAGGSVDSQEFVAALGEYGSGATVVTGPELPAAQGAGRLTARLRLTRFYCERSTGDTVFGPADEIYWVTAAGADSRDKKTFTSQEFGSINTGSGRDFPAGTYLFNGGVQRTVISNIECWERDEGGRRRRHPGERR